MPKRIDHVIVAAADLEQLEAIFTRLGFHVVGGGRHPHLGTQNRIILLDQGYIELLAIADDKVVSPAVRGRVATAPGWIGFALQSTDIVSEASSMRARGADVRGPKAGRLVAPDGSVRSWQTVTLGGDDLFSAAEPIPFLIQHDSSGLQHQQELAGTDIIALHQNGAQRLYAVILAVANLSVAEAAFERDYGLLASNSSVDITALNARTKALPLPVASERIVLAEPLGSGLISNRLTSAGDGVCCVTISITDLSAIRDYFEYNDVAYKQWGDGLLVPAVVTGGAPLAFVKDIQESSII